MRVDPADFPLVWIDFHASTEAGDGAAIETYFREFESLLLREQPFVVLAHAPREEQTAGDHDKAALRQASIWMKQHKRELRRVLAMIVVEPSAVKRYAGKAMATVFGRFWGYPLMFAASAADARALAAGLLAAVPGANPAARATPASGGEFRGNP